MADTYEQNLSQKGTLTVSDYIRVVGSDNASYKQLVSDVAKKIIENYTGSSLAGSSQSVKSAIDALNSKTVSYLEKSNMPSGTYNYSIPSRTVFKVFYAANGNNVGVAEYTGVVYNSASSSNLAEIKSNRFITVELTNGNLNITTTSMGTLFVVTFQ